MLGVQLGELGV